MDRIKHFQDFLYQNKKKEKLIAVDLINNILEDKLAIDEISDIILDSQDDGVNFKLESYYFFHGRVGVFGDEERIESKEISKDIVEKLSQLEST